MKINIKYFGIISEICGRTDEELIIEDAMTTEGLSKILIEKYPEIKNIKFQFAINLSKCDMHTQIIAEDQIALLPQFSGG